MTAPTDAQLAAARKLSEIKCFGCYGDELLMRNSEGDKPCIHCRNDEGFPTGRMFWWYYDYDHPTKVWNADHREHHIDFTDHRTWPYYDLRWLREQGCWVTQYPEGFWFLAYPTAWDRQSERLDTLTETVLKVAEVKGWIITSIS